MKVIITKNGMTRMANHISRLKNAQKDGYIDEEVQIPTETDILLELIVYAKNTPNGFVECMGDTYIKGQDYKLEEDETDAVVGELKRLRDYYIIPNEKKASTGLIESGVYEQVAQIINNRIDELMQIDANDDSYEYDGEIRCVVPND